MILDIPNLPGALCAETDPELFFPEIGQKAIEAREICMACDVRAECLQWALDHDETLRSLGRTVEAGTHETPEERQRHDHLR